MNKRLAQLLGRLYRDEGEGGEGTGAPPAGDGIINPGGNIPSFKDLIPPEYKDNPTLAPYQDIGALIKSHISAQSLLGTAVQIPKEGDVEAQNKFYERIGRPKTAAEYQFSLKDELKEVQLDPKLTDWSKETFHKYGLTPAQANGLLNEYVTLEQAQKAAQPASKTREEQDAENLGKIEEMFGAETELNMTLAERAGKAFFDQDGMNWLEETGLGNHPEFVKTFAKIGRLLKEDENFSSEANAQGFASGPGEAQAEIGRLNTDQEFMKVYMTPDVPGHKEAVARMFNLYKIAYPGKVKS